ncbi:MAG: NAD(P)/FAD-dependent oxidoreductase [Candidatus Omnitrophica bacterium]|nr:NAD(P)/FAD-dependent oxidoreductase [Candidatus Omnitrophota bacterium]
MAEIKHNNGEYHEACTCKKNKSSVNLPVTSQPRIVIIGGGFGGLELARRLKGLDAQVVLLDKNNYHTFQPLLYQVATAALEPQSIACPFREIFRHQKNFFFRMAEVRHITLEHRHIETSIGMIDYDYLVLASGSGTNFFGLNDVAQHAVDMKSVTEAIGLRHLILENFEQALLTNDLEYRESLMNFVIVGAGPTGVELAGALGELKNYILPQDYPELDLERMQIHLVDMEDRVFKSLSKRASFLANRALKKFDVNVWLNTKVESYDGKTLKLSDGKQLHSKAVIWAAGVKGKGLPGLDPKHLVSNSRIKVDPFNRIEGHDNIFVIGDVAAMISDECPKGHPMLAPVAIQQAKNLSANFRRMLKNEELNPFRYKDYGVMATIGRNRAVVDLKWIQFNGSLAWLTWVFFHIMSLVGFRNRVVTFINWLWNYISYDRAVRLIIKPIKNQYTENDS